MNAPDPLYEAWGERIRAARTRKDLTQTDLARLLGVSQQQISRWEHGIQAPRDRDRIALARELGVSVDQLFAYPAEVLA